MRTYTIIERQTYYKTWEVEADSEADARDAFDEGDAEEVDCQPDDDNGIISVTAEGEVEEAPAEVTVVCHRVIATGDETIIVRARVESDSTGLFDEESDVLVALSGEAQRPLYDEVHIGMNHLGLPVRVTVPASTVSIEW